MHSFFIVDILQFSVIGLSRNFVWGCFLLLLCFTCKSWFIRKASNFFIEPIVGTIFETNGFCG